MQDMYAQGKLCKEASYELALKTSNEKNEALKKIAKQLNDNMNIILEANQKDITMARLNNKEEAFIDRLALNKQRIEDIIDGVIQVCALKDPCGNILDTWDRDELHFIKKSVPIGVIGIIYEARPNVSVDAASLCLKSGNVCYLRGSKDAIETNKVLVSLMRNALLESGFNENAIALVEDTSYEAANAFMKMKESLDLLIPRGSAKLIKTCVDNASVPIIETGSGNCHIYIDQNIDIEKVIPIVINAKCQRISVCNACESLLIHQAIKDKVLPPLLQALKENHVKIHGDDKVCAFDADVILANEEDYAKEYLDYEISIKIVEDIKEAIQHINHYHTMHSDAILSENSQSIETFMNGIDSAVVYANASTRFSDGNEFGLGAEIGISTQKIHARGPMGLEALTTYKYLVYGKNTIRK